MKSDVDLYRSRVRVGGPSHREMARAGALLWAAGGMLGVAVVVLPHWQGLWEPGVLVTSAAAFAVAAFYWFRADAVSLRTLQAGPLLGAGAISALVHFGGGHVVSAAFAMLYLWVAMYVAYFHPPRFLAVCLVVSAAGHALALLFMADPMSPAAIWVFAAVTSGMAGGMVAILVSRLRGLAETDSLTGLVNRRVWDQALAAHLRLADRLGHPVSIGLIDLDDFKQLNDEEGHEAGDAVLAGMADRWSPEIRDSDILGRWGGDEFAVILPASDLQRGAQALERLRGAVGSGVSVSAGVACWDGAETPNELVRRADLALYRAKERGRNRVEVAERDGKVRLPS